LGKPDQNLGWGNRHGNLFPFSKKRGEVQQKPLGGKLHDKTRWWGERKIANNRHEKEQPSISERVKIGEGKRGQKGWNTSTTVRKSIP